MLPRSAGLGSTTWKNKGEDIEDDLIHPEDEKARSPRVSPTWSLESPWLSPHSAVGSPESVSRRPSMMPQPDAQGLVACGIQGDSTEDNLTFPEKTALSDT